MHFVEIGRVLHMSNTRAHDKVRIFVLKAFFILFFFEPVVVHNFCSAQYGRVNKNYEPRECREREKKEHATVQSVNMVCVTKQHSSHLHKGNSSLMLGEVVARWYGWWWIVKICEFINAINWRQQKIATATKSHCTVNDIKMALR